MRPLRPPALAAIPRALSRQQRRVPGSLRRGLRLLARARDPRSLGHVRCWRCYSTASPEPPSASASVSAPNGPPSSALQPSRSLHLPFRFETGIGLFAKRSPRPFPPPFLSPPSGSFSDPLSTHDQSRDRRAFVNGELIRGLTNGDDAVYASDLFVCANDGVGAWATRPRGHAG